MKQLVRFIYPYGLSLLLLICMMAGCNDKSTMNGNKQTKDLATIEQPSTDDPIQTDTSTAVVDTVTRSAKATIDTLVSPKEIIPSNFFEEEITKINTAISQAEQSLASAQQSLNLQDSSTRLKKEILALENALKSLQERKRKRQAESELFSLKGTTAYRSQSKEGRPFSCYLVDPQVAKIRMFWQNEQLRPYGSFTAFAKTLDSSQIMVFATNGGMYLSDQSPQGLYIEEGKELRKADIDKKGYGNFYLQPNGIFLLTEDDQPYLIKTEDYKKFDKAIRYATQSGPMLIVDGSISSTLGPQSTNFHIRSGVGITQEGQVAFIISDVPVRFYELAEEFEKLGCQSALYLDGAISETYLPILGLQNGGGGFGVMIAVIKDN